MEHRRSSSAVVSVNVEGGTIAPMRSHVRHTRTPTAQRRRRLAVGAIVGPVGFVGAWLVGSLTTPGYSMVEDAISRLAAAGADTRWLMTAGFIAFGLGVPAFGLALRAAIDGPAWIAAIVSGIATIGVAALPLDVSRTTDVAHGAAATLGYVSITAVPLLAATPLARAGFSRAAHVSRAAGVASAICLAATLAGVANGLFQRLGLTIGDAWLIAAGVAIASDRDASVQS